MFSAVVIKGGIRFLQIAAGVYRAACVEMLMAATTVLVWSRIGAAIERSPSLSSRSTMQHPSVRTLPLPRSVDRRL